MQLCTNELQFLRREKKALSVLTCAKKRGQRKHETQQKCGTGQMDREFFV